ncbi:hypothetical protein BGZ61DRAFT_392772 [Ilyonectria robusta]|uniref:uncharacterized protein n=1 Tax=Ilyonectria robusta TaxID=1079257 RepID=UPI001E8E29BE|nr:uncharacterized protein BGZ61DRAFT_392772 [Ilyonectria robusta]KAH8686185.1 hypothetical protein BGZ61DRAFT_392772 [Ilyonectria robusta]
MVNRGRPSKDCLPCRKRKLRCDLKLESCGQCQRAKIVCHGYRNLQDLVFRDETDAARHKVLARSRHYPAEASCLPFSLWGLSMDMTTCCRETFFSLYLTGFSHSYTSLVTLYTQAPATGHLACSVDAVSLAFTAVQFESQEIMSFAKKRYVAAIQNLGQALRDPKALESNEVLQSVLVLDVYEKLSNREAHTRPSWMSHVQGAMSLVAARGSLNFSNPIACQLTRSVVTTLIISCGAAMVPVPESIISLRKELDVSGVDKKWDFMAILLHIVNLRADVYHDGGGDRTRVVEKAKDIDRNLASLEKTLPEFWKPVVVLAADNHGLQLLDGQYDVYPSHFATQLWNTLRAMRLEMAKIIKDYHQSSEPDASETINRISRRICHTVPQFILPGARPDNAEPFSSIQKLQCRALLAPLYLAACVSTDTHIQEWICNSIDYMAEKGNIRVAKDITDMLRTRSDIDYWTVWAMTGCYAMTA